MNLLSYSESLFQQSIVDVASYIKKKKTKKRFLHLFLASVLFKV